MRLTILAVVVLPLVVPGCSPAPASTSRSTVAIYLASAQPGGFAQQLAEQYSHFGDIQVKTSTVDSNFDQYEAIEQGKADIVLGMTDSAYFAYRRNAQSHRGKSLRAIATLQVVPLHMVARGGIAARGIEGLRGRRVGVPATPMAQLLVSELGLIGEVRPMNSAAALLAEGKLDALLIASYYPAPSVDSLTRTGAHLISITGPAIDRLREQYPFIRLVAIPANTYEGQTEPIYTIGAEVIYACRSDLDERVVYELTRRLFDVLPLLAKNFSGLRALDVRQAAATIIPLHDGATRYYRELELLP